MHGRRRFLTMVGGVMATSAIACSSDVRTKRSGPVAAGNVSAVPLGHLAFVAGGGLILGRDSGGLYAMTSICTHQDCDISSEGSVSSSGISCTCHGSRFSTTGAVIVGPASSPLEHYRVDLAADGAITIQAGTVVDAATRTAPPT
jgi:nitrite reductase/ring-hydroxylating ferredoxin subunit